MVKRLKNRTNFINTIYVKGRIILISDLDTDELIGCCMFNVSEYFFSTQKIMTIQMITLKKSIETLS